MAGRKKPKVPTRRRAKWLRTQTEKVIHPKRGKGSYRRKEQKEDLTKRIEEETENSTSGR